MKEDKPTPEKKEEKTDPIKKLHEYFNETTPEERQKVIDYIDSLYPDEKEQEPTVEENIILDEISQLAMKYTYDDILDIFNFEEELHSRYTITRKL